MHPFCRSFHLGLHIAATILPWKSPIILEGNTVYADIGKLISKNRCTFIVTDSVIQNLALTKPLLDYLDQEGYPYVVYDKVSPNPTVANIEEALALYHKHDCHTLIAFGGGSPMDCGKGLLARVARPKKSLKKMKGLFKVLRKIRPLIAIPTTAGTGSETTVCAVVSDDTTKYVINDLCLIPPYAAFIPELTCSLPPHVTATTGMDALVHAVESYIGVINGKQTRKDALQAVTLIHKHLLTAYEDGNNLEARREMQHASFYAGKAFTRACVGNIHAMAHNLGGLYHVPHGLANAVVQPLVLREYGEKIYPQLAELSDSLALTSSSCSTEEKAKGFLNWIDQMNQTMKIPSKISEIQKEDLNLLAERAYKEANPLYPVPVIFSTETFHKLFSALMEDKR